MEVVGVPDVVKAPLEVHGEVAGRLSCAYKGTGKSKATMVSTPWRQERRFGCASLVVEARLRDEAFGSFDEALGEELVHLAARLRIEVTCNENRDLMAIREIVSVVRRQLRVAGHHAHALGRCYLQIRRVSLEECLNLLAQEV